MTLSLKSYQERGVDFCLAGIEQYGAAILGDRPGLGKTGQALRIAEALYAEKILVLCPAILMVNWARELDLWWQGEDKPTPVLANAPSPPFLLLGEYRCVMAVVNYEKMSLSKNVWRTKILSMRWDMIILDEAHALKDPKTKRTKAVYGELLKKNPVTETAWLPLSGTLAPNHAGEVYSHMRALFPETVRKPDGKLMSQHQFEDRFCIVQDTKYGRAIVGTKKSMIPELRKLLRPHFISRKPEKVLKDLPPLRFADQLVPVKVDGAQANDALKRANKEIRDALKGAQTTDDVLKILSRGEVSLSSSRRILGIAKARAIGELILSELSGNHEKLIVFLWHPEVIDVVDQMVKSLGSVSIDGRTPADTRQAHIDAFQNDPETRVFIGQTRICSEGITLTAAHNVLLGEPSWVPKDNYQAAKRAARIGQTRPVLARYVIAENSVDEDRIMPAIKRKTEDLTAVFG